MTKKGGGVAMKCRWGIVSLIVVASAGCSWGRGKGVKVPVAPAAQIVRPEPVAPKPEVAPPFEDAPVEIIALPESAQSLPSKPQPLPESVMPAPRPVEPVIPAQPATVLPPPQSTAPIPPNTFRVTVALKDASHPSYGEGNPNGFVVNGEQGRTLVVKRGEEYTFDVQTDIKHDFYLGTNPVGWGGGAFSSGVRGNFTYRGEVTLNTSVETPDTLYYQCRNHKSMGGKIMVVNADANIARIEKDLAAERKNRSNGAGNATGENNATNAMAAQKIAYANMIYKAKANKIAPDLAKRFQKEIADGENMVKSAKDDARTLAYAEDLVKRLNGATQGKKSDEALAESSKAYHDLLEGVHSFEKSHAENIKRAKSVGGKGVEYDKKQVDSLVKEAAQLAEKQQFDAANPKLQQAQRAITLAINEMLHQQTIVYDKNFATPKDEYEFELGRHDSYVELIPVAREQRPPSADMEKLIEPYTAKAENLRAMAVKTAGEGDHKNAILMLQAGTENVQRILRLLGVSM